MLTFMPQFHSARDIHQILHKRPSAKFAGRQGKNVKAAHENGFEQGQGWRYDFDVKKNAQAYFRTHDIISARMLASNNLKIPHKHFR